MMQEDEQFPGFGTIPYEHDSKTAGRGQSSSSLGSLASTDSDLTLRDAASPTHKTLVAEGVSSSELWRFGLQFGGGSAKDNFRRLSADMSTAFPDDGGDDWEIPTEDLGSDPLAAANVFFGNNYVKAAAEQAAGMAASRNDEEVVVVRSTTPPGTPKSDPRRFSATRRTVGEGSPHAQRRGSASSIGSSAASDTEALAGTSTNMRTLIRQNSPKSKVWESAVAVKSNVTFFNSSPLNQRKGRVGNRAITVGGGGGGGGDGPPCSYSSWANAAIDLPASSNPPSPNSPSRRTFFRRNGSGKEKKGPTLKSAPSPHSSPLLRRAIDLSGRHSTDVLGRVRPDSPMMVRSATIMTRAEEWLSEQNHGQR